MNVSGRKLYLNKGSAKLLGVCAGLAEYLGVDTLWVRLGFVAVTLFGSGIPFLAYLVLAMAVEAKPAGMVTEA
ncbi:PspC domain-containing protein [Sphingoaurantiacus capsulatus]|uniref:PspC domain-containing protein n=1 Tax=Sphingoaurantiacus capsulatus TaxID=1771310 RepID=A0ABV7X5M4_9SPHN